MNSMCTSPLGDNDEALIRAFRLRDQRAGNALFRRHEAYLKRAGRKFGRKYDWLDPDDLDGATSDAFAKALTSYDPSCGTFKTYLAKWINGALRSVLEDRMRNGVTGTGTSRAGRWLSGAWEARKDLPLEQIAKRAKCSPESAREALAAEIAIREGTVPIGELKADKYGNTPADLAELAYGSEDLDLRRRLDAEAKAQRALGWPRYQRDLANGEARPGGIEPTDTRLHPWMIDGVPWPTRAGDVAIRASDYFNDLARATATAAEKAKGQHVPLTPDAVRAAHERLEAKLATDAERRFLPGSGILPDPNAWRKPHPSRIRRKKPKPASRFVISNAVPAAEGAKKNVHYYGQYPRAEWNAYQLSR